MVKVKSLSYKDLILSPSGMTKKQPTFEPSPHCCAKTSLLFSSPSLSVWYVEDCFLLSDNADAPDIFEPAPFEIDDTDTRNTVKKYRRHGTKCTSVYILYLRVCTANTLLTRTTAIRGAVDQCTFVYTGQRQVFLTKNLLLFGTTAVRGGRGTADIKPSHE